MKSAIKIVCLFLTLILTFCQRSPYQKIVHNIDPQAKCLDGSSPALYEQSGSQPQNILIYLIGGGSCLQNTLEKSIQSCYERSKSLYGSSLLWPQQYDGTGLGVMQINQENRFSEWTKIGILYCDGMTYQGSRTQPLEYKDTQLYFRGANNMRAHLKWIDQEYDFASAQKIVMMGGSAGGIGVYMWIDYVRDMLDDPDKLYGVVDSAIFMDLQTIASYVEQSQQLIPFFKTQSSESDNYEHEYGGMIEISDNDGSLPLKIPPQVLNQFINVTNNDQRPPNTRCLQTLQGQEQDWKCLLAPKALQNIETKLLFIQSQYDTDVISLFLPVECITQGNLQFTLSQCSSEQLLLLDFYRGILKKKVFDPLIQKGHGVWSNSCAWHVATLFSYMYDNPQLMSPVYGNKMTVKEAIQAYVFQDTHINSQDEYPWPSNENCAF